MTSNTFSIVRPILSPLGRVKTSLTSIKSLCVYLSDVNLLVVSGEQFSPEITDFVLLIIDLRTGKQIRVKPAHTDLISQLRFHSSRNLLFTTSLDGHLRVWNHHLKCIDDFEFEGPVWAIELLQEQGFIVVGGEFEGLKVFEFAGSDDKSKAVIRQTKDIKTPSNRYCASLKFIKPHNFLAMGCREAEEVLIYDWNTKNIKHRLRREYCYEIVDYLEYFEPTDTLICAGSSMDSIYWNFSNPKGKSPKMCVFEENLSNVSSMLMNKFDKTFWVCQYNKFLNVMNIENGSLKKRHLLFDKRGDTLLFLTHNNILVVTESKHLQIHFFKITKGI